MTEPESAPAAYTVLPADPAAAPASTRTWHRLAARPRRPLSVVRGAAAVVVGFVGGLLAPFALALAALATVPACEQVQTAPLLLKAIVIAALMLGFAVPCAIAGPRLWWLGVPVGLLVTARVWTLGEELLTKPQSGFCF